jgi:hypothetical protein
MKASAAVVILTVLTSTFATGCAQNREVAAAQRQNAELRARVATLESQVAQLKDEQARSPITIDGLTLSKLEAGELRLSPKPIKPAEREIPAGMGMFIARSGHLTGTTTYTGTITIDAVGQTGGINVTNLETGRRAATTTTTTKATSTTTPAK